MVYTLGQAAKATGKSKTTILRALEKGKISGEKNDHGEWAIQPVELHRLYPLAEQDNGSVTVPDVTGEEQGTNTQILLENRELRAKLEATEARLGDAHDQIGDLRRRLDTEAEERRRLTLLLTDQRTAVPPTHVERAPPEAPPKPARGFWAWLTGSSIPRR